MCSFGNEEICWFPWSYPLQNILILSSSINKNHNIWQPSEVLSCILDEKEPDEGVRKRQTRTLYPTSNWRNLRTAALQEQPFSWLYLFAPLRQWYTARSSAKLLVLSQWTMNSYAPGTVLVSGFASCSGLSSSRPTHDLCSVK
jgi:hypothetical protein